ncbi:hypothetical protein BDQ17DRAFT_1262220, partial [Cyathus striatus]
DGKDAGNVARGLKAAAHNPRVSEEAKERVTERLHEMGTSPDEVGTQTIDGKDAGNVLRGHKATLHNPHVSDEAKANSEKILREHDAL